MSGTCKTEGCNRRRYCRGLCSACYQRGSHTKRKRRESELDAAKERENRWLKALIAQWPAMGTRDAEMSGERL